MNNLLSIYQITHGGNGRFLEFTPNSAIIRYLESRSVIATRVVDHSSWLYSFSFFSLDDASIPIVVHHTYILHHHSKKRFGFLKIGVLTLDIVLDPSIPSLPPTIVFVDTSMATNVVSSVSV
jgi:hypothetical protein